MGTKLGGKKDIAVIKQPTVFISVQLSNLETKWLTAALMYCLGDQGYWWGLSAAPAHGLPRGAPPAHAGLLAEREGRPAKVRADRQHAGQADPQPQHSEEDWGGDHRQVRGRDTDRGKTNVVLKGQLTRSSEKYHLVMQKGFGFCLPHFTFDWRNGLYKNCPQQG